MSSSVGFKSKSTYVLLDELTGNGGGEGSMVQNLFLANP